MPENDQSNTAATAEAKARTKQLLRKCEVLLCDASKAASLDNIELAKHKVKEIEALIKDPCFPSDTGFQISALCKRTLKDANDARTEKQVIGMFSKIITGG